ncbi:MAG: tetratricopeptide repeat protein [Pseudomonadota bacterium]|nr:tetratricopeptide repeat protein [Pseudomonadota bacterium]
MTLAKPSVSGVIAAACLAACLAVPRAEAAGRQPLADEPSRVEAQIGVLTSLVDSGLSEQALQVLAQVRAQGETDKRLDVLQARAMHATGMSDEARALLEGHVKRAPRDPAGWAALGIVLADSGDLQGSLAALEHARRLTPDDPVVLNNLGYARLSANQTEEAVRLFRASLTRDPSQPRTRNNLGFALARLERDMEALQAFRAANPEADARYNLGVACVNRGDRGTALTQFNAALDAAPGHPAAAAALDQLLSEATP